MLRICFLLADGRFQSFQAGNAALWDRRPDQAVWLQLQFHSDEELHAWSVALSDGCSSDITPELPTGDGWMRGGPEKGLWGKKTGIRCKMSLDCPDRAR